MKIAVLVAMEQEMQRIAGLSELCRESGAQVLCVRTGIGKVNAARAAAEVILTQKPDAVINSGCAGSMKACVKQTDWVVGNECAWHDVWCGEPGPRGVVEGEPRRFACDPRLLAAARRAAEASGARAHDGLLVSGDQFFVSLEEDRRILGLYPDALAADMESAAVAQVCRHYGVPFLSVRIISDEHLTEEGQKATYNDFWSTFGQAECEFLKNLIISLQDE